jgi:hypothetical protein
VIEFCHLWKHCHAQKEQKFETKKLRHKKQAFCKCCQTKTDANSTHIFVDVLKAFFLWLKNALEAAIVFL